jgi:hypothetical protein
MAQLGRFHRIHRQRANGIGEAIMGGARSRHGGRARNDQEQHL